METTIKGLKKAVGEFNAWQGAARIYFDTSDKSVWCNVYTSPGNWDEYHNNSISEIAHKATIVMAERDNKITMKQLKEICERSL